MSSITTSVRIKPHLRQKLEWLSIHSRHGINWIIEQAVEAYFERKQKESLRLNTTISTIKIS